jgi:hypothetical protein
MSIFNFFKRETRWLEGSADYKPQEIVKVSNAIEPAAQVIIGEVVEDGGNGNCWQTSQYNGITVGGGSWEQSFKKGAQQIDYSAQLSDGHIDMGDNT